MQKWDVTTEEMVCQGILKLEQDLHKFTSEAEKKCPSSVTVSPTQHRECDRKKNVYIVTPTISLV
jgi:hypothetical protein